jgi:hypothetical protein
MSKERKYQDREIRQILNLAIGQEDGPAQSLPAVDGLTLRQLQEVGREVGLPADGFTQAVAAFEGAGVPVPRGKLLGLPASVGRIVPLPRKPSVAERGTVERRCTEGRRRWERPGQSLPQCSSCAFTRVEQKRRRGP